MMPTSMTDTDRIVKQVMLDAPRSRVWRALTDVEQFNAWFGVSLTAPFSPGAEVSGKHGMRGYEHVTLTIRIEKMEPERFFSFRWHPYALEEGVDYDAEPTTLVTFTLEDATGGTRLTIVESGFDAIPESRRAEAFGMHSQGWAGLAEKLRKFVTARVTARDLLVRQFGAVYSVVARNVDGLTHADSLAPAAGGGNTANWILGHLVDVQNGVMQMIGGSPVWESEQLERARFDHPIRDAAEAIDWDTLVERFNASRDACLAALASLTDESLTERMPDAFGRESTRAEVLGFLVVHQSYHAGQLGMARRAAGHRAAILAPGQNAPL